MPVHLTCSFGAFASWTALISSLRPLLWNRDLNKHPLLLYSFTLFHTDSECKGNGAKTLSSSISVRYPLLGFNHSLYLVTFRRLGLLLKLVTGRDRRGMSRLLNYGTGTVRPSLVPRLLPMRYAGKRLAADSNFWGPYSGMLEYQSD